MVSRDGAVRAGGPAADGVVRGVEGVACEAGELLAAAAATAVATSPVAQPGLTRQRLQLHAGGKPLRVVPLPLPAPAQHQQHQQQVGTTGWKQLPQQGTSWSGFYWRTSKKTLIG